jgi:RimJ/RimL family protein N-acetyltransferase
MLYIGNGQTLSRFEAWRNMAMMLGHWQLRGYGMWAVEERHSGVMIGRIGCWQPEGWPGFEIGWTLRRAYWGCGYATEAARAAMAYAFGELQQSHVISLIHPDNSASRRVAQKLGEKLEGTTEVLGMEAVIYALVGRLAKSMTYERIKRSALEPMLQLGSFFIQTLLIATMTRMIGGIQFRCEQRVCCWKPNCRGYSKEERPESLYESGTDGA